jgi:hypothetical protein
MATTLTFTSRLHPLLVCITLLSFWLILVAPQCEMTMCRWWVCTTTERQQHSQGLIPLELIGLLLT